PAENIPAQTHVMRGYEDGRSLSYSRPVAPGVTHAFDVVSSGPITLNTVTIDPREPSLRWEVEKARDEFDSFETVWAMSQRLDDPELQPVVVINADFWAGNNPINLLVDEGWIWRSPYQGPRGTSRSVLAFDDLGNFHLGVPQFKAELRSSEFAAERLTIELINVTGNGDTTAYTPVVSEEVPAVPEGSIRLLVELDAPGWLPNRPAPGRVVLMDKETKPIPLSPSQVGIMQKGTIPEWLTIGAPVELSASIPELPGVVTGVTGGGPMLVEDGRINMQEVEKKESITTAFITTRHPRSAVGIREDGHLVLVTVDGRQGGRSIGMGLQELAEYMKSLGCVDALNFDGGGSTSLVVRGELVNFPSSNGVLRPVSTALVIQHFPNQSDNPVILAEALPTNLRLPEGVEVPRYWEERRANWIPGERHGKAVTAGESAVAVEHVACARVEFPPNALQFKPGETKRLSPRFLDAAGVALTGAFVPFELQHPEFMSYKSETRELTATGVGTGTLTLTVGGSSFPFEVVSGGAVELLVHSFDADPSIYTLTGTRHHAGGTRLGSNSFNKVEGGAALEMHYAMLTAPGVPAEKGTTKIALGLNVEFPADATAGRLRVYGDGQGAWLRSEWRDAANQRFVLNLTGSNPGVDWSGTWKDLEFNWESLEAIGAHSQPAQPPYKLESLYVVQTQESRKSTGVLSFDDLRALVPAPK
ncbi:MAG: phosphodiester glycosidase family protein, partial [Candidatus Sumerlaeia bacterium]|nr:phosphodiester glycosidase family protein [Candidatus Sumerlaeia bacterium]